MAALQWLDEHLRSFLSHVLASGAATFGIAATVIEYGAA